MELTLLAGAGVLAAGLCVVAVRRAGRPRTVVWARLCGALVGLATRDLFRPRHRGGPRPTPRDRSANRSRAVADGGDGSGRSDDAARSSLVARLRRRVDGWLG
ncbi:hypothetical protein [Halorussus marinus]|nr:hypothetical protein [Halorussus marinus]